MSNRISTLLMITLAGLAALITIELRGGIPSADAIHIPAANDPAGGNPAPIGLSLPPLAVFSETVSRPLFVESRRPPDEETTEEPAAPQTVMAPAGTRFSVSAIVITESERSVLLSYPPGGSITRVTEGETVAGWRLERVESDRAIFTRDGETREETLRTFGPPPAGPRHRLSPGQAPRAGSNAAQRRLEALRRRAAQSAQEPDSRD